MYEEKQSRFRSSSTSSQRKSQTLLGSSRSSRQQTAKKEAKKANPSRGRDSTEADEITEIPSAQVAEGKETVRGAKVKGKETTETPSVQGAKEKGKETTETPSEQIARSKASDRLPGSLRFSRKIPFFKTGREASGQESQSATSKLKDIRLLPDPNTTAVEDTSNLPPGGSQIPQEMHFFWKGESPGRENKEWKHLQQWGNMGEKSAGWNKTLWTDQASHDEWKKNHQDKLSELSRMSINVKTAEDQIDERNKDVYNYAVKHDARTMASDVARYSILKNHGGIYADLDMTPGKLSLPSSADQEGRKVLSSGRLPFFGPRIQDHESIIKSTPSSTGTFKERLQETVNNKYERGEFNNNLIAAEPNDPTIDLMINKISGVKEGAEPNDLKPDKTHLGQIAPSVTGPIMAGNVMREQMKLNSDPLGRAPQAVKYMNPQLKDHLINNMELLTDASDK